MLSNREEKTSDYSKQYVHPERQYLDLVREILDSGVEREDRTGIGTKSVFGRQIRFSLSNNKIPILTTKKVFVRGVIEELLWMISGSTDANDLSRKGIRIWDLNASREFLDNRGLTGNREGDLGPVYGFQWRHFGADYIDCDTNYTGQGIDQLSECIEMIRRNPNSRRIIVSSWNPSDIGISSLPPCHLMYQFYVFEDKLSCHMYQRSCDMGLGVPFNIASYSLLTHIIAYVCDLEPHEFIYTMGDSHVYLNHVDALKRQLERRPKEFPTVSISGEKDIDLITVDDVKIYNYVSYGRIKMEMAV